MNEVLFSPQTLSLIAWLVLCLVISVLGGQRNRNRLLWFVIPLVLSPLIGAVILYILPVAAEKSDKPKPGEMDLRS